MEIKSVPWSIIYPTTLLIPEFEMAYPQEKYKERLNGKPHLALAAFVDHKIVGFKIGYEWNKKTFYSWVGGVTPDYRKRGIAKQLADEMESACLEMGYTIIRMKTQNRFKAMLHFAIGNGFHLTEVIQKEKPEQNRIILEKRLFDGTTN